MRNKCNGEKDGESIIVKARGGVQVVRWFFCGRYSITVKEMEQVL
jgi:hypothetical protein